MIVIASAIVIHAGDQLSAERTTLTPNRVSFVDRYLEVAEELDPSLAEQLRSMCQRDPARFERVLRQLGPDLAQLADLRETDPSLFWRKMRELHLEASIEQLASTIRQAKAKGEDSDPAIQAQLRGLVEAQVGSALNTQAQYLDRIRAELTAAEAKLKQESDEFDATVNRRLEDLLQR